MSPVAFRSREIPCGLNSGAFFMMNKTCWWNFLCYGTGVFNFRLFINIQSFVLNPPFLGVFKFRFFFNITISVLNPPFLGVFENKTNHPKFQRVPKTEKSWLIWWGPKNIKFINCTKHGQIYHYITHIDWFCNNNFHIQLVSKISKLILG